MTDLEDRIREALKDPRRQLAVWPDPMWRIRHAVRRQRAAAAAVTAAVVAAIVTPLALLSGLAAHPARPPGKGPSASTPPPSPVRGMFGPSAGLSGRVPSWAKHLRGEVAYKCADRICLMRPDGSASRTLTATFPEWDPAWSPNGRDLAFRGYYGSGDGQYDLYAVSTNGCHLTRLTHGLNGTTPSWSPNGRRIAFTAGGIDVINPDGTGFRRLIADTSTHFASSPTWSVRNQIAFVRESGRSPLEIYAVNADGSGLLALTRGGPGFGQPSWSPDGRRIALVAITHPLYSTGTIEVASADGASSHAVSPTSWMTFSPTWTPDGKIVFLRQIGAPTQSAAAPTSAYIVNPDGSGLHLLYPNLNAVQITWGSTTLPKPTC